MLIAHSAGSGADAASQAELSVFRYDRFKRYAARNPRRAYTLLPGTRASAVIINWGVQPAGLARVWAALLPPGNFRVLNANITNAVTKQRTYRLLRAAEIKCPVLFDNAAQATASGVAFMGRTDRLHSGLGITAYEANAVPAAHEFYTQTIMRRHEFRVHVFCGAILATQYKNIPEECGLVASHRHGCTYTTRDLVGRIGPLSAVTANELALRAVTTLGLDFGAVDLIMDTRRHIHVLEVNTAPGIEAPSTTAAYVAAFIAAAGALPDVPNNV